VCFCEQYYDPKSNSSHLTTLSDCCASSEKAFKCDVVMTSAQFHDSL
jgi:hypothetical protein